MKKFLLLMLLCFSLIAKAEEATTSCNVGNSSTDYVSATAYTKIVNNSTGGAYVTIANSSNKPLVSLYITVTAEKGVYYNGQVEWETVTLYSSNKYFSPAIAPNSTTRVECGTAQSYAGRLRNISISIGNPSCK